MSTASAWAAGSASDPDVQHILLVCAANVCRSPLMEIGLRHALASFAPTHAWHVTSAGASARPGELICPHAAKFAARYPRGTEHAAAHRSRALAAPIVEQSGLILVASHGQRAAIAGHSPEARRRTFTLREAVMMMKRASAGGGDSWPRAATEADLLPMLVDLLHDQRGTLAISAGPAHASSQRRRRSPDALDIVDVHAGGGRRHKPVFQAIADHTTDLGRDLSRISLLSVEAGVEPQQKQQQQQRQLSLRLSRLT